MTWKTCIQNSDCCFTVLSAYEHVTSSVLA